MSRRFAWLSETADIAALRVNEMVRLRFAACARPSVPPSWSAARARSGIGARKKSASNAEIARLIQGLPNASGNATHYATNPGK